MTEPLSNNKIELKNYFQAVWKKRLSACVIISTGVLLALIYNFIAPEAFRSQAVIIPVSSEESGSSKLMTGLLQGLALGGGGSKNNTILLLLKSKKLRTKVIESLKLEEVFIPENKELNPNLKAYLLDEALSGLVKIDSDKIFTEKITIMVEASNPEFSTKIAKQYLVELQNLIHENSFMKAKRYRLFLEEQIAKNKEELLEMGKEVSLFYRKNPISEQGRMNVPIALLSEAGNVQSFKNYQEFKAYLDILQNNETDKENVRYVKDVPQQIYLSYVTMQQKILEEKNALLVQSYQMALLDEAKQEPTFQILEEPVIPPFKYKPQRKLIMLGSFCFSVFVAILYALFTYQVIEKKKIS